MSKRSSTLPVGKLPAELLAELLGRLAPRDPRVIIGPGLGLDCSVVRVGQQLLVFKSDPITFATKDIGYYLVQVNASQRYLKFSDISPFPVGGLVGRVQPL